MGFKFIPQRRIGGFLHEIIRTLGTTPEKKKILGRYSKVPTTLLRITGANRKIILRDKSSQDKKGSRIFDFIPSAEGLICPAPLCNTFIGPNGLSFRPPGLNMWEVLDSRKGNVHVCEIPEGLEIPSELVILHEHGDHYSLQPTSPMNPSTFIAHATKFLKEMKIYPKDEYFSKYPI